VYQIHEPLGRFRDEVYQVFNGSRDAAFEMIDAIASSPHARSVVEVSDSPLMRRRYASVYKSLERTQIDEVRLRAVLRQHAEAQGELEVAGYRIQALDHTPYPRPSAPTVSDRGFVHGAEGIVIGHQYSLLGRVMHTTGAWVGIEDCARIPTDKTPVQVGAEQVARLREMSSASASASTNIKHIITADSEYLTREMLDQADPRTELLIRLKNNRVLYHRPTPRQPGQRGRPAKHGRRVKLSDARTLGQPDHRFTFTDDDGNRVEITVFTGLHVRSHPEAHGCVIRVCAFRPDGKRKFARPMWLFWTGPHDMDWLTFWRVYLKRYCLESVHQFAKNSLAWTSARLGYTDREERWTWLVMLAYWHLLLSAPLAHDARRPWQKPMPPGRRLTPARVQRDYWRIFLSLGTPALPPKPRGIPPGRPSGYRPTPRPRFKVIYKRHMPTFVT
jgi:hypothetical protein